MNPPARTSHETVLGEALSTCLSLPFVSKTQCHTSVLSSRTSHKESSRKFVGRNMIFNCTQRPINHFQLAPNLHCSKPKSLEEKLHISVVDLLFLLLSWNPQLMVWGDFREEHTDRKRTLPYITGSPMETRLKSPSSYHRCLDGNRNKTVKTANKKSMSKSNDSNAIPPVPTWLL
jgi:hypothetical protein